MCPFRVAKKNMHSFCCQWLDDHVPIWSIWFDVCMTLGTDNMCQLILWSGRAGCLLACHEAWLEENDMSANQIVHMRLRISTIPSIDVTVWDEKGNKGRSVSFESRIPYVPLISIHWRSHNPSVASRTTRNNFAPETRWAATAECSNEITSCLLLLTRLSLAEHQMKSISVPLFSAAIERILTFCSTTEQLELWDKALAVSASVTHYVNANPALPYFLHNHTCLPWKWSYVCGMRMTWALFDWMSQIECVTRPFTMRAKGNTRGSFANVFGRNQRTV